MSIIQNIGYMTVHYANLYYIVLGQLSLVKSNDEFQKLCDLYSIATCVYNDGHLKYLEFVPNNFRSCKKNDCRKVFYDDHRTSVNVLSLPHNLTLNKTTIFFPNSKLIFLR